jgi:(p)ppGpp synthase/HD superfamily hydrolase
MMTDVLGPDYHRALEYATIIHAAQVRKGTGTAYITHPVAVAELVVSDGGTETAAIAALLHDAVEDQGGRRRLDDIERRFGARVAEIVAGCSEWIQERHQKSADEPSWEEPAMLDRFSASPKQILWYHRSLVEAFRGRGSAALHAELERTVAELEARIQTDE